MRRICTLAYIISICAFTEIEAQTYKTVADNSNPLAFEIPAGYVEGTNYLPKTIVFKLKEGKENALTTSPLLSQYLQAIGAETHLMFPQAQKPERKTDAYGRKLVDLTRVYLASYTANLPVKEVMKHLKRTGVMEYVQPQMIVQKFADEEEERILLTPNDPNLNLQWHIPHINVPQAWDITTGDPSVIIAITDGGTNLTHTDLQNIAYNTADPIDGVDNDGNGWVDDYRGWNTALNNNDVQYNPNHGVFVTGLASATVNNNIFGVGVSYQCPYLPVRISNNSGSFTASEPGVFYAAERGAKIINCSWGDPNTWPLMEDVTKYAAINKGCLVVAAAGNSNSTQPWHPAAYDWVTGVAGSNSSDIKSTTSSYYEFVNITAPGQTMYSTSTSGFTVANSGTSYAAPLVSGSAALVFSHYPSYTAEQVDALLKETSFNLYTLPGNAAYADKLGRGRLDIGAALTTMPGPSIKMITRNWTDGNDDNFSPGENVSLSGNFINWLNPSSTALKCTLSTNNPFITVLDSVVTIGVLNNLAIFNNSGNPFTIHIQAGCPTNTSVLFKLKFEDGSYIDKQFFTLIVNPNFLNVTENMVHTSVSSTGRIGFMDDNGAQTIGLGVSKNGEMQHLVLSSFMLANSTTKVSDAGISAGVLPLANDFVPLVPATKLTTPEIADFDAYGSFNDNNAGANRLDIQTNYKVWAWNDPSLEKFVIIEYTLKNIGLSTMSNLFSGIYSYWETPNAQQQMYNSQFIANWDGTRKLGYAYNNLAPLANYAGVKLLSYDSVSWYAFNNNGTGGSMNLFDGFSETEKYNAISNGVSRASTVPGTSISGLLGTGPLNIPVGDSVRVAFAIVLGDDLSDIQAAADAAQALYDKLYATWTGNISSDWNNPNNWFPNHVPNSCITDVKIPHVPNQPVINDADFTVGNLTAADSVVITIQGGHQLNVCKNIQAGANNGVQISGGKLHLMGNSNQRMAGNITTSFINLDNAAGATIQGSSMLSVDSGVELINGDLTTNGNLTLLSDASGTAYIDNFSSGYSGSISGSIHVQRYNPAGIAGFRQLGTPVQLPNINALSGFIPTGTPGFVIPQPSCDPNSIAFNSPYGNWMQLVEDGNVQYNCAQSLFQVLTSGGMTSGRGYYMDVPGNSTLTFTGIPNNGPISFGLTHANGPVTDGWNMVSNPYPSPLQWEMSNVPPGVDAIGKVWQTSGTYMGTFMDLDPSLPGTQSVAIGQAFQVRVSTPGASVPFIVDNIDRTITPPTYLFAGNNPMTLDIDIIGGGFADLTRVRFIDSSTIGLDAMYDSPKMFGNSNQPMVYSVWNSTKYSTNSLGIFDDVYAVPLGVKIPQTGNYTLAVSNVDQFPGTSFIYLEDIQTGSMQDLRANDTYNFTATVGIHENRFILHFYPPLDVESHAVTCDDMGFIILTEEAPISWDYTLSDQQGLQISQGTLNGTTTINNLETGTYHLTLVEPVSGYTTMDTITVTGVLQVSAQPNVSAQIAELGQEIQFTANATNADSFHWDFGDLHTSSDMNPAHIYNTAGTFLVTLTVSNNNCQNASTLEVTINNHDDFSVQEQNEPTLGIWLMNELLYIHFKEVWEGKTSLSVYDASGKRIHNQTENQAQGIINIDSAHWAAGIYTIRIEGKNRHVSRKITKGIE